MKVLVVDDDADAPPAGQAAARPSATPRSSPPPLAPRRWPCWIIPRPDVLLSDIGMPLMDGYEFIRKVRAARTNGDSIPAAALTAFARSEDRRRACLPDIKRTSPNPWNRRS